jgi:hypothetical protein
MPSVVVGWPKVRPASSSGMRTAGRRVYLNKSGIEYSSSTYNAKQQDQEQNMYGKGPTYSLRLKKQP